MSSENTVKLEKMKSSDCPTAAGGGGEIRHPHPWVPDQRDGFISWLRAEFAAANVIIDCLCHHLRCAGEPGEYEVVLECVQQRRVSWSPVLHLQPFFPCTEIMHALQQVDLMKKQRAVGVIQGRVGGDEFGTSVVLDFASRKVQRVVVNGGSHGVDCQNLNANAPIVENRVVKERRGESGYDVRKSNDIGLSNVPNATVDGSLETSRNPDGANIPYKESQLKDVKVEKALDSEGCDIPVTKNDHSIQNQSEESLTVSPKSLHAVVTNDGNTVNVAEGSNIYEELLNQADNSMLLSPVNDLSITGRCVQIPAIDSRGDIPCGGDYEANRTEVSRFRWSHDEDMLLINAWLNTDKVVPTNQKPKAFWKRVADHYSNGKLDTWVERGSNLCKSRWVHITWPVAKFCSCYEEACKQKASDQSEDDVIWKAHQLYHNEIGKDFSIEHAWRALRSESKWRDIYLKVKTNDIIKGTEGSAKRKKKMDENKASDDSEANLQCDMMEEEESKMKMERDKRKREKEGEYLLAKKYDLLSNLIAQAGSLTSEEMRFKSRLVEDLLKQ